MELTITITDLNPLKNNDCTRRIVFRFQGTVTDIQEVDWGRISHRAEAQKKITRFITKGSTHGR